MLLEKRGLVPLRAPRTQRCSTARERRIQSFSNCIGWKFACKNRTLVTQRHIATPHRLEETKLETWLAGFEADAHPVILCKFRLLCHPRLRHNLDAFIHAFLAERDGLFLAVAVFKQSRCRSPGGERIARRPSSIHGTACTKTLSSSGAIARDR